MKQNGLDKYLKSFLEQESLFKNKKVFQSNFVPPELLHRDDQQEQIAGILAPGLKGQKPSNLFIYGKTGTGIGCPKAADTRLYQLASFACQN